MNGLPRCTTGFSKLLDRMFPATTTCHPPKWMSRLYDG